MKLYANHINYTSPCFIICNKSDRFKSILKRLDTRSFELYRKGDVKNLRKAADSLLSNGIDYYYLRMRLGITEYNRQLYNRGRTKFIQSIKI